MVEFLVRSFLYLNHYYNSDTKVIMALSKNIQTTYFFYFFKFTSRLKITCNIDPCLDEHIPQKEFQ